KLAFTVVLVMLLTPAIGTAILFAIVSRQSNHVNSLCKSNMETLSNAFMTYAKKHNDTLPSATNWAKSVQPYVTDVSAYRCPNDLTKGFTSYAMNDSLSGKKLSVLKNKSQLVLLYEVEKAGDSPHGDGKDIYSVGHENGGHGRHGGNFYRFNFYLFADGHVGSPKVFNDTYNYYWQNGVKPQPAPPSDNNDQGQGLLF
ncbi:MAG: hypothetical protein ABI210_01725, partial [Abditibacteriaceae bacterium]